MVSSSTEHSNSSASAGRRAIVALSSAPNASEAQRLAHLLVEKQLAACVSIVPQMTSVYRWEGTINTESEALLLIKTFDEQLPLIEALFAQTHPYDTPELISCNISGGSDSYLAWLAQTVDTIS